MTNLLNAGKIVHLPANGDFITDEIFIEVGVKSKTAKQVKENQQHSGS